MKTLAPLRTGSIVVDAPATGVVRFAPPSSFCGELEVFDEGEAIAVVGEEAIVSAPARGFVLRSLAGDGVRVDAGRPILIFSIVPEA